MAQHFVSVIFKPKIPVVGMNENQITSLYDKK